MSVSQDLLFFFSALGAFNGILLSIYFFFFARPKHSSNYFLGGLLAALSIRIWKSVFLFFNPELAKIYLQIGLSACFFIGPFLYLFVKSKVRESKQNQALQDAILLLLLLVIVIIGGYLYPYELNIRLWQKPLFLLINYQWLIFILLAGFLLRSTIKKILLNINKLKHDEIWILSVYFGVLAVWVAYYTSYYTSYIVGALSFSFVLYLSIILFLLRRKKINSQKQKYANKKIVKEEADRWFQKIDQLLKEKELYKDANLNLAKLSKQLQTSPHFLSQLLNDNLNKSFSQFINEYRIEAAKKMLQNDCNLKMEVVAERCGFNSNSTFYTAFKKFTNTTPAKYMNSH